MIKLNFKSDDIFFESIELQKIKELETKQS